MSVTFSAIFLAFCRLQKQSAIPKEARRKTPTAMHPAMARTYLIFVIFFTQTKILDRKFYTEERVIYGKRISRQNSVNCYLLAQANYKYQDQNYTLSVKLHTECKSTLGLGKNEKCKFVKLHTVCKTTPSVKAHLVCGRIEKIPKITQSALITHRVKTTQLGILCITLLCV